MKLFLPYYLLFGIAFLAISCSESILTNPMTNNSPGNNADSLTPGLVFIGSDDGSIYALDLDKGTKQWSAKTDGPISTSPYVHTSYFHNGTISSALLVVGSEDGTLYTYNAFSGQAGWSYKTGGAIKTDPVIVDGSVLVESEDGHLYSLNELTGKVEWSAMVNGAVGPNLVVYLQSVYCSSKDGNVYAIDKTNGNIEWAMKPGGDVSSSPALYFSSIEIKSIQLWVGSFNGNFYKMDAATGELLDSSQILNRTICNAPLIANNQDIYGGDTSGFLVYIEGGIFLSSYGDFNIITSSPTCVNRLLYIGSGNSFLYQFETGGVALGEEALSFKTGGPIESSPVVADSIAYVGSDDKKLYAVKFSATNFQEKWEFETGGKVRSSACVMDKMGIIYHPYFSGWE
jgi:outer membrane protein assembly factor BamB